MTIKWVITNISVFISEGTLGGLGEGGSDQGPKSRTGVGGRVPHVSNEWG